MTTNTGLISRYLLGAALAAGIGYGAAARADVFDDQVPNDDSNLSENELVHKTVQLHDLASRAGVADVDYYPISVKPYSSYEVIIDNTSAEIAPPVVERVDNAGIPVQSSIGTSAIGYTRTLRWENTTSSTLTHYVKVASGSCTTTCSKAAVYRIRAYDTTYTIPRFYDHGTLLTSVLLQNPNDYSVAAHVYYWMGHDASLYGPVSYTLAPLTVKIIPPEPALGGPPGGSCGPDHQGCAGHIVVTSTAGYGELAGKSSQVDTAPSTPQSWDWPMHPRP
jgi:hypothetical protein